MTALVKCRRETLCWVLVSRNCSPSIEWNTHSDSATLQYVFSFTLFLLVQRLLNMTNNFLVTWRRCKLIINLGIVKFFLKFIKQFLNYFEICRHTKMVKKAAEHGLLKFFFLSIGQSNPPLFSYTVSDGIKPLWDETAFPDLIVFFRY